MFFNPLSLLIMLLFFFILVFSFAMVQINLVVLAFEKIGIPPPLSLPTTTHRWWPISPGPSAPLSERTC